MKTSLTKMIRICALVAILLFGVAVLVPAGNASAADGDINPQQSVKDGIGDIGGSNATPLPTVIKTIVNVLLYFIGILSVIMVIYGGFRYVTSAGDTSAVASAKNTILYAVVGIVVAVTAYAIVNFVIGAFTQQPAATDPPRECISSPSNPNVQLCNY